MFVYNKEDTYYNNYLNKNCIKKGCGKKYIEMFSKLKVNEENIIKNNDNKNKLEKGQTTLDKYFKKKE